MKDNWMNKPCGRLIKRCSLFLAGAFLTLALSPLSAHAADPAPIWQPLIDMIVKTGLDRAQVEDLFGQLPATVTQSPMGRKIRELYRRQFLGYKPSKPGSQYYKGVVTDANAVLCRDFIREHRQAFDQAYAKYGVPPAIACALLFVETRLGKVLGDVKENAFYTLASMASTRDMAQLSEWYAELPGWQKHEKWLRDTLRKRADWAARETAALVAHMIRDGIPPERLPGSIYGAVGLCQFMPSNIDPYGADGDSDGCVDLFTAADAIASCANYLARHGWKRGLGRAQQHKLLMTYNHAAIYANTILALSQRIEAPTKKAVKK